MSKVLLFDTKQALPPQEATQIDGPLSKLRVYFQPADDAACGNYRCILPAVALRSKGAKVKWAYKIVPSDLTEYDVFIFQRPMGEDVTKQIKQISALGKVVIVELDDNLHNVPTTSPVHNQYTPAKVKWLTESIKAADGLIVSTPELADFYSSMNSVIGIAYNSIDFIQGYRDWSGEKVGLIRPTDPNAFVLGWRGGICHSKETEVLTKSGFKLFSDLLATDEVAQYDPMSKQISFVIPLEITKGDYTGKMYSSKINSYSVTDNHRMYSLSFKNTFERAKDISGYFRLPCAVDPYINTGTNKLSENIMYLIGVILSQGTILKKENIVNFTKVKTTEDKLFLINIFESEKIPYTETDNILSIIWENGAEILQEISGKILTRTFPSSALKDSSYYQRLAFLMGFVHSKYETFKTDVVKPLPNQIKVYKSYIVPLVTCKKIQELASLSGIHCRVKTLKEGNGVVNFVITRHLDIRKNSVITKDVENETVYCVRVPTQIICTRLNGEVIWSGNSHMEDIKVLKPTLKPLMDKNPNLHISLYSALKFSQDMAVTLNIHKYGKRIHFVQPRSFIDYPTGLKGPDAYVIPLSPVDKLFNSCKSELALAEVGAVGCPSIASNCAPYNRFADNNNYALTVDPGHFYKGIQHMIDNRDFTKKLGELAYLRTTRDYNLDTNFIHWVNSIQGILQHKLKGIL